MLLIHLVSCVIHRFGLHFLAVPAPTVTYVAKTPLLSYFAHILVIAFQLELLGNLLINCLSALIQFLFFEEGSLLVRIAGIAIPSRIPFSRRHLLLIEDGFFQSQKNPSVAAAADGL